MLKVGITGGLGSGKTIVCNVLRHIGVPVFDADTEAKNLLERKEVQQKLHRLFSDKVFTQGTIDKKKLASLIFNNDKALQQMNALIHPLVAKEFLSWTEQYKDKRYVVIEAALIFESGQFSFLDQIITVYSPLELRVERATKRDRTTKEEIMRRISKQLSDEQKCKLSQSIIYNDEEHMLLPQILELDKKLREG